MDDTRKQWYDITFWIVFAVGAIGMVCNQFYIMRRDFRRDELFNPMISKYLIYSLGIMCITVLIGVLLKAHLNSNTFATLVMVCTVFLIIPNMFWHDLANATDLSCNYAYKVLYEWKDGNRQEAESLYYRFFEINSVMMLMLRCVGISVILLYVVRQTHSQITLWTIIKIALIIGCLSFSIMYVVKITDTTSRLFEKNPMIDHLYMFQQDFIYSMLIFILIYFWKKSLEKKQKLVGAAKSEKQVGVYLTVICAIGALVLLVAKDRLFDLGEYTGINVISLMWKRGETSRELPRDFMIICVITLFELIGIGIFNKLMEKRYYILQLILTIGMSFIIINRWTFYFQMTNMLCNLDGRLRRLAHLGCDVISYFNPIQFMMTLVIIYIMQVKSNCKRKSKIREIAVVVCLNFLAYFCYLPTKAWFQYLLNKGMFNDVVIIFEESIRAFILIIIILVLLLACILLVNEEKLSFCFNKVEVIIDTIFFTMTILCAGFYVKKEYCLYTRMDRRFYLDYIGSTFQYQCWSMLMNLWFSLLVFIAVSISILLVTKIRNKIVKYMIVGFSLGVSITSKILISQFLKTALGRRLCAYLIDRPNANGCFIVAEGLLRTVAVGLIIFAIIRCIKKTITPIQVGILVAALNVMTLCRYTLDDHHFYMQFPFHEAVYTMHDLAYSPGYNQYSTITFAIGLIPIYLVIKTVFFNKRFKMPSIEKKDVLPMTVGVGLVIITCGLVLKNNLEQIQIICRQLYLQRMYIGGTSVIAIVSLAVMGPGYVMKKRQRELVRIENDKKQAIEREDKSE